MTPSQDGSIDFWRIRNTDIVSGIGDGTIFSNPSYCDDLARVRRSGGAEVVWRAS